MRGSPKGSPQSRTGKLVQLDAQRHDSPRTPISPTIEQFLAGDSSKWSPHGSPVYRKEFDLEEDHSHHQKKSVLTKVREKAKKLRHSLSKKRREEDNSTPSWGVSLEDEEEEDAEYLGAPMYESELAPEEYKEHVRQHPRADPVILESHTLSSLDNHGVGPGNEKPGIGLAENKKSSIGQENEKAISPNKTLTETVSEKLAPAYATMSDATHAIASKIHSLTVSSPPADPETDKKAVVVTNQKQISPTGQIWDKGVSVKEYVLNKFEPGEDEKALSQVITDAMSPRRSPREGTVVEKVKGAVSSLIWSEEPSQSSLARSATHSSPTIPISTNAYDVVEEETHGRILQAN